MLETSDLGEVIAAFVGTKELLVLHGHEHPTGFSGAEWHEDDILPNGKRYFRSQVCSSMDRSACGHLIRWENSSFRRWRVEGPWEVVVGEPL
jgi:hypothetical protein